MFVHKSAALTVRRKKEVYGRKRKEEKKKYQPTLRNARNANERLSIDKRLHIYMSVYMYIHYTENTHKYVKTELVSSTR